MTGNSNPENVVNNQGAQGQPSPDVSGNPPASPSGNQEGAFTFKSEQAFIEAVQKAVAPKVQSIKDKRIAGIQSELADVKERLAGAERYRELVKGGRSETEALMQMQIDALSQTAPQPNPMQTAPAPNQVVGSQNNSASAVNPVLSALGINPNDADYLQAQANGKIVDFIKNKLRPAPQSVVSQPSGGQIPASNQDDAEVLKEQLQAEMQKPRSTRDRKKVAELKTKLVEATRRS